MKLRIRSPMTGNRKIVDQKDRLLTLRGVAELDQVSERTVRRAINAGLLDVIRVGVGGRLVRIHPNAHRPYRRAWER